MIETPRGTGTELDVSQRADLAAEIRRLLPNHERPTFRDLIPLDAADAAGS